MGVSPEFETACRKRINGQSVQIFLEQPALVRKVWRFMDDLLITEAIESVRDRLHEEIPDLQAHLDRLELANYRKASSLQLQECLTQVTYNLDMRVPRQAREIQRRIALAEASTPAVGAGSIQRAPSWVIQENVAIDVADLEQDTRFSQGLRYLSLPPSHERAKARAKATLGTAPADHADIPITPVIAAPSTRFAQELFRCTSTRQAVALARRRLPSLRGLTSYEFLAAIGYPTATPSPDAVRFCRYVGLLSGDDKTPAESYIGITRRAARVTGIPVTHISYLLAIYSGAKPIDGFKPICSKKPQCGICALSGRCTNYTAAITVTSGAPERGRPINEWAVDERPRERLLAGERLSNSELLAIILRTGSGRLSAVELARELINQFQTLHDLEKAGPHDIVQRMKGKGIGMAKAAEICAAIEIGRRVCQPAADTRLGLRQVASSRDVFDLCRPRYKAATQEEFLLLILNTKNRVQKEVPVSLGTLNSSIVHPRDVFRHALREAAAAVIFVHNHPSGDPAPSDEDILLTARLVEVGKLLGIQVLDHVIIGSHEWFSFADHGRLK